MKNGTFYGLSILLLAVSLNSCGKTTKRKITNDWRVVFQEEEQQKHSSQTNEESYWKSTMTENTVTNYSYYTLVGVGGPASDTTENTGVVKANKISIKKDGTWNWIQELSYDENAGSGNLQNTTTKRYLSGSWSFVGKTKGDDFKKNERIVFNVLVNRNSSIQTENQTTVLTDYSEETTYLTGENTMTFTVKESKNKELVLEMESIINYSNSMSAPGVNSQSKTLKMTLKSE